MKRLKKTIVLMMSMLLISTVMAGCGSGKKLRIGTAGEGGNYDSVGRALSQVLAEEPYKISMEVKTTAGSAANIRLLSKNYLELAFAQSDVIDEMYYGTLQTEGIEGYSAVAALYSELVQIVVKADSQMQSVSDLAGKTVSVGEVDSGTQKNASQILQAYGLTSNMLKVQNMTYAEATKALQSGEIDAMFCTAGAPARVIEELAEGTDIRLIPIEEEQSNLLTGAYEFYSETVIPAGIYSGQQEDVKTLAVRSVLLASDQVSADTVYTITSALFAEKAALDAAVPISFDLHKEKAAESVTIPFHPGAARYYQEEGVTVKTAVE